MNKLLSVLQLATLAVASCKKHERIVPTYTISGRLLTYTGRPVPNYKLGLAFNNQYEGSMLRDTTDLFGRFSFTYSEMSKNFIGRAKSLSIIDIKEVPYARGLKGIPINTNLQHDAVYDRGYGWAVFRIKDKGRGLAKAGDTLYISGLWADEFAQQQRSFITAIIPETNFTFHQKVEWNANLFGQQPFGFSTGWNQAYHPIGNFPTERSAYTFIHGAPVVDTVDINY